MKEIIGDTLDLLQDGLEADDAALIHATRGLRDLVREHGVAKLLECLQEAATVGAEFLESDSALDDEISPEPLRLLSKALDVSITIARAAEAGGHGAPLSKKFESLAEKFESLVEKLESQL